MGRVTMGATYECTFLELATLHEGKKFHTPTVVPNNSYHPIDVRWVTDAWTVGTFEIDVGGSANASSDSVRKRALF